MELFRWSDRTAVHSGSNKPYADLPSFALILTIAVSELKGNPVPVRYSLKYIRIQTMRLSLHRVKRKIDVRQEYCTKDVQRTVMLRIPQIALGVLRHS